MSYDIALWLLLRAKEVVAELRRANDDDYGLLESAGKHIIEAISDLEDDLK